jgi:hypothetical protein
VRAVLAGRQWARFVAMIPEDERGDLIKAYNKRLFSGDLMVETRYRPRLGVVGERAGLDGKRRRRRRQPGGLRAGLSRGWRTTIS